MLSRTFLALIGMAAVAAPAFADDDDRYLLRPAPGAMARVVERYGLEVHKSFAEQGLYLVRSPHDDEFADHAAGDPDVLALEQDQDLTTPETTSGSMSPNTDSLNVALAHRRIAPYYGAFAWDGFALQPAASQVGVMQARAEGRTGNGVVAVIDTGIDPEHPLLRGALVGGHDFTRDLAGIPDEMRDVTAAESAVLSGTTTAFLDGTTTAFLDSSTRAVPINQYAVAALDGTTTAFLDAGKLPNGFGHGTMVASLIRLVAPTALILPVKAFDSSGHADTFNLVRAIHYAADFGADVINMSFSMPVDSPEMRRAIQYALARNVVFVSSAGNSGNEVMVYPAAYDRVLGVASTDLADRRSPFSNYGNSLVSLAAPGQGVVAAYPGGSYAAVWGTSFATPLVAGAIALQLQEKGLGYSAAAIEAQILESAIPLADPGLGAGRLSTLD